MTDNHLDALEDQVEAQALDMAARMERMAADGEWTNLHQISADIRDAVMAVPEKDRRNLLLRLQHSNQLVQELVQGARKRLEEQLASLRVGRDAAEAYEVTNKMTGGS